MSRVLSPLVELTAEERLELGIKDGEDLASLPWPLMATLRGGQVVDLVAFETESNMWVVRDGMSQEAQLVSLDQVFMIEDVRDWLSQFER
jgi:hypothetical protein